MSVETVLGKMITHNADVLGCIATHGGKIHHNLPDRYGLVDSEAVAEYASLMFEASDALETDHEAFDQIFMEYDGHSVYARRLDDGVLVLLTDKVSRARFKKAQVGVNLFMKPLKRALAEAETAPPEITAEPEATPSDPTGDPITPTKRRRWF